MSNNFVSRHKKNRLINSRIKIYAYLAGALLVLMAGWYFISHASFFQVKTIVFEGLTTFSNEEFLNNIKPELIDGVFSGLLGYSNYLVWPGELEYKHPAIASLQLQKDFWNKTITFKVVERGRYGIWCQEKRCSWFDEGGNLFGTAPTTEGYLVYKINGELPDSSMPNILKALEVMKNKGVRIKQIAFDKNLQELRAGTAAGAKIIFNTRTDPTAIFITAYDGVIRKLGLEAIEYLDLTVENRIYYQ